MIHKKHTMQMLAIMLADARAPAVLAHVLCAGRARTSCGPIWLGPSAASAAPALPPRPLVPPPRPPRLLALGPASCPPARRRTRRTSPAACRARTELPVLRLPPVIRG